MFPLFLLLALGAVGAVAAVAASQKGGVAGLEAELARLKKENPTAYSEVARIMREGASAAVLIQYGSQLHAQGYPLIAQKFGEMAKKQTGASAAPAETQPAAPPVGPPPEVSQDLEPSMAPELQRQLDSAIATVTDPAKLNALAALMDGQGYPTAARVLREKATALLIQVEASQAVRAADAVMKGESLPPPAAPGNPTTAAVTATKAATVVNKVAEAMTNPTPEAVKVVAKEAVSLASSSPATADYKVLPGDSAWRIAQKFTGDGGRWKEVIKANPQKSTSADGNFKYLNPGEIIHLPPAWASNPANRALLVAAQNALQNPSASTLATVARAGAEVANANATSQTSADAERAVAAALALSQNPTASQASRAAAVTAAAANRAVSAAGVPIAQSGKTTYVVKAGDSAWKIAQAITGNGARYPELIRANIPPSGRKTVVPAPGGGENFTTLSAGEVLKLPASWVSAAPKSTITADLPGVSAPPAGAMPDWARELELMKRDNPNLYSSTVNVKNTGDAAALKRASEILSSKNAYYPALSAAFAEWAAQKSSYGASPPAIVLATTPAASPAGSATAQTYTVLKGDSPWKISEKLSGSGSRWKELVAANPQKAKAADGTFKTLNPGEVLQLPASWSRPVVTAGYRPPLPHRSLRAIGHLPFAA